MYPRITKLIFDEWQEVWNCCTENKPHAIKPTVGGRGTSRVDGPSRRTVTTDVLFDSRLDGPS